MSGPWDLPTNYQPLLSIREIETAIKDIKDFFEKSLAQALNLQRVSAPLFVRGGTGVNDDLNGVERPVRFPVKDDGDAVVEIVQSLAKWKRMALGRYGFQPGDGLYTDMNAIRPDETLDSTHSIYVDQWDWEKIITPAERTRETLEQTVRAIYDAVCRTEFHIASAYSNIRPILPEEITFVTSEELYRLYPDLGPRERETRICAEPQGGVRPWHRRRVARRPAPRRPGPGLRRLDHAASRRRMRAKRRHSLVESRAGPGVRDLIDGDSREP